MKNDDDDNFWAYGLPGKEGVRIRNAIAKQIIEYMSVHGIAEPAQYSVWAGYDIIVFEVWISLQKQHRTAIEGILNDNLSSPYRYEIWEHCQKADNVEDAEDRTGTGQ